MKPSGGIGGRRSGGLLLMVAILLVPPKSVWGETYLRQGRIVMGTLLQITLANPPVDVGEKILAQAFEEAQRLDRELTHFRSDSGLSRLNAWAGRGPRTVSGELFEILRVSVRLSDKTRGAFDVTVGPLLEYWKRAALQGGMPEGLEGTLYLVGWNLLRFSGGNRVSLSRKGMRLNLGAIGKGFAVDRIVELFRRAGLCCAFIDFGGSSFFALGRPPDSEAWNLLLRGPHPSPPLGVVSLREQALSVSAVFGQAYTVQGKPYGHIIDPRSGFPLTRAGLVVVSAPTATEAEGLSTGMLVLGPTEGYEALSRFRHADALFASGNTLRLSGCFERSLKFHPNEHWKRKQWVMRTRRRCQGSD